MTIPLSVPPIPRLVTISVTVSCCITFPFLEVRSRGENTPGSVTKDHKGIWHQVLNFEITYVNASVRRRNLNPNIELVERNLGRFLRIPVGGVFRKFAKPIVNPVVLGSGALFPFPDVGFAY